MKTKNMNVSDVSKQSLILVNQTHPLRSEVLLENLVPCHPDYPQILLEKQAAKMLLQLFKNLNCFSQIVPVSGYRSWEEQEKIYADSLRDNGEVFTSKFVALPGCSEHQTGFAIDLAENKPDIDFIRPDFPDTGICQKFREQAAQYGFVERYQAGCESITGIAAEPWHFRYVGFPHSMLMKNKNLTLEEYTEWYKRNQL